MFQSTAQAHLPRVSGQVDGFLARCGPSHWPPPVLDRLVPDPHESSNGEPTAASLAPRESNTLSVHDLRHSAASYLAMSGATVAEIAEVLGHKTLAMVKRYSHLTEQHTSRVVARMTEKFFGG